MPERAMSVVVLFSSDHFLHLLEDKQVSQRVGLLIMAINPSGKFFSDKVLELSASPNEINFLSKLTIFSFDVSLQLLSIFQEKLALC